MSTGKAKLFTGRKDLDGVFHRGKHGRKAASARAFKRAIEKGLRQRSRELCRNGGMI